MPIKVLTVCVRDGVCFAVCFQPTTASRMAIGVNILERGILRNCSNVNDDDDDGGDGDDPKKTKTTNEKTGGKSHVTEMNACLPACLPASLLACGCIKACP